MKEKGFEEHKEESSGKISPNDLEILIHYNSNPITPFPRTGAPAVDDAIDRFIDNEIIRSTARQSCYKLTSKGRAWLQCILATPFPKKVWLDGNGKLIDIEG
jgi:hypothetical protein